jgi:hypothetical protein
MKSLWKRIKLAWTEGWATGKEIGMLTQEEIDEWNYIPEDAYQDMKLMGMTPLDMVREFQLRFGRLSHGVQLGLIEEEYQEFLSEGKPAAMLKELADMVYVIYGYAMLKNWDLDEAVRRVHVSNMSKLGLDGQPIWREDGKVLKGPNYCPPNLEDLV